MEHVVPVAIQLNYFVFAREIDQAKYTRFAIWLLLLRFREILPLLLCSKVAFFCGYLLSLSGLSCSFNVITSANANTNYDKSLPNSS